jgi:adenosine deaminase
MLVSLLQCAHLSQDAITRVVYEIAEDCVADGVRYLEIRFSPILHTKEGLSLRFVTPSLCGGQALVQSLNKIQISTGCQPSSTSDCQRPKDAYDLQ